MSNQILVLTRKVLERNLLTRVHQLEKMEKPTDPNIQGLLLCLYIAACPKNTVSNGNYTASTFVIKEQTTNIVSTNFHQNQTQFICYTNLSQSYLLCVPIPHSQILKAGNFS